ncbi:MAG: insulinase family protein [Proteobacteria bacterium]|nr:insulinase family protein [Pseudomonadota bacterium]
MAEITFDHENINGWDVYLVDTGIGNEMAMAIRVETGALHDDPKVHAGRAHLWEHVIFQGSKSFPDPNYFFNEANKLGATDANAYTADDHTLFLLKFHESQFSGASKILTSLFREPLLDPKYFNTERDNVVNEAKDYKARDDIALNDGLLIYLLEENHPFRMYHVGEESQLNAMTIKDLATLYYSNYRPGSSAVFVSGNFRRAAKDPSMTSKEQVLANLKVRLTAFEAPKDLELPPPNKDKVFPSLKSGAFNYVEFKSTDENVRSFQVNIPFEADINPIVLETLTDYLNIQLKGALAKELKDANVTTQFRIQGNDVNNIRFLEVYASLDHGQSDVLRDAVVKNLFKKIKALLSSGLNSETIQFLRQRNISSYEKMKDPLSAAEHLGEFISKWKSEANAFNFRGLYSQVTLEQMQEAARILFTKPQLLMSYVGPDVVSSELDPVFGRAFNRIKNQKLLDDVDAIMKDNPSVSAELEIPNFNLTFREKPLALADELIKIQGDTRFSRDPFLVSKHSSNEGALQVEVEFSPNTKTEEFAAMQIFLRAFIEENRTLFTYFDALSIKVNASQAGNLIFSSAGNSLAALKVQEWFWPAFKAFKPNADILKKAKTLIVQANAKNQMNSFPPQITIRQLKPYFYVQNAQELEASKLEKAIEEMDLTKVTSSVENTLDRTDLNLGLYGDYDRSDVEGFAALIKKVFPKALTAEERVASDKRPLGLKKDLIIELDLPSTKKVGDVSLMRAIPGASFENIAHDDRKLRAFYSIAEEFLNMRVFDINRNEKALGYVQRATSIKTKKAYWMLFLGMTGDLEKEGEAKIEGDSRAALVVDGWKRSLELLRNISNAEFEEIRAGIQLRRKIEKVEIDELMDEAFSLYHQSEGVEHTMESFDSELATLSYEQFLALSKEFLLDQNIALDVVSSRDSAKTRNEMAKSDSHYTCQSSLLLAGTKELPSLMK